MWPRDEAREPLFVYSLFGCHRFQTARSCWTAYCSALLQPTHYANLTQAANALEVLLHENRGLLVMLRFCTDGLVESRCAVRRRTQPSPLFFSFIRQFVAGDSGGHTTLSVHLVSACSYIRSQLCTVVHSRSVSHRLTGKLEKHTQLLPSQPRVS